MTQQQYDSSTKPIDLQVGVVTVWYGGSENIDQFVFKKNRILRPDRLRALVINYFCFRIRQRIGSV